VQNAFSVVPSFLKLNVEPEEKGMFELSF